LISGSCKLNGTARSRRTAQLAQLSARPAFRGIAVNGLCGPFVMIYGRECDDFSAWAIHSANRTAHAGWRRCGKLTTLM
jgi:hypothetical protein